MIYVREKVSFGHHMCDVCDISKVPQVPEENTKSGRILQGKKINKSSFFKQQDSLRCSQGKKRFMYISLAPYDDRRRTK